MTGPLQENDLVTCTAPWPKSSNAVPHQEITVSDEDIAWAQTNAKEWKLQAPRHRQALLDEAGAPHV